MDNSLILKEIAVQIIGFAVVFFVLKKLAWSNLLGAIDARRKHIADELGSVDQKKKDIEALEKEYKKRLEHIEQEARERIQEASLIGQTLARDIQEKARADAQKLYDRTKAEIDQDIAKARLQMRNDIVEISSMITEKVLREKLDAKEHDKLVEKFIRELEKVS